MVKKRILFVDDEPRILEGLKRMLRSLRHEFIFDFAESGTMALEKLSQQETHLIVTDMRMPGMDGIQLLKEVQQQYPSVIRIMLSGQTSEEHIIKTIGIVHQFLYKPCEPDHLKSVLLRASALHNLISKNSLRKIITGLGNLPSVPEIYQKLRNAMADPETSVAEAGAIIEKDMAMSAKILQLVNSAFFGLPVKVNSPSRGVHLLGIETVKNLVLGLGAFAEIGTDSKVFSINKLWSHSMAVGHGAKLIAMDVTDNQELINNCFTAGILHDIGILVLASKVQDQFEQAVSLANGNQLPLHIAERELLGITHESIGAYLMGLWGMPGPVIEAIGFHHNIEDYPETDFCPALAVYCANCFHAQYSGDQGYGAIQELNNTHMQTLGREEEVLHWKKLCLDYYSTSIDEN